MSGDGVTTTPDERGVRRGVRHLSVVLTADELAHVAQDMAKLAAAAEDAKADVDAIKAENKERIEGAKNREATARANLTAKARVLREGKVERGVPVTIRTDWRARKTIITRDDTGDVVETSAATPEEIEAVCTWETRGALRVMLAPDGTTVLREVALTDAEKQAVLPLPDAAPREATDGTPPATPGTTRAWIHRAAWEALDHRESESLEHPDEKGPFVPWVATGDWYRGEIPTVVLSQVETFARKAEARLFVQPQQPTLEDLRRDTPEETTRLKPKGRKGALPPKGD